MSDLTSKSDYAKLHFTVFLFGFTAVLGKLILIPSFEMVFYRTLLAMLAMGFVMMIRGETFRVSKKQFVMLLTTGVIVTIHWVAFFSSGKIANPSVSLVGFATCSLWTAFLEPLAKRKKVELLEVGLAFLVCIGLLIIFLADFQYWLGLLLGILAGFTASLFSVINSRLVHRISAYTITFYEMLGAAGCILFMFPFHIFFIRPLQLDPSLSDWIYIMLLAWVCSVYAYSVAINLTRKFTVFYIQLALNLEPMYGMILAVLILGQDEIMNLAFYAGSALILSGVIIYPYLKQRMQKKMFSSV